MKNFIYDPIELSILYLLNEHNLVDCINDNELDFLNSIYNEKIRLLCKIINILKDNKNITTGGLLCKLFNENRDDLITVTQLSVEPMPSGDYDFLKNEFLEMLKHVNYNMKRKKIENLIKKLNNSGLSQKEKEEFQELILDVKNVNKKH